jgi:hypothetical protein
VNTLRALITDAMARTPDPREVAAIVSADLTVDDKVGFFDLILPTYVRVMMGRARLTPPQGEAVEIASSSAAAPRPAGSSAWVASIRDWWSRQLETSYAVNGDWKHLRDLTRADVLIVAAERREMAARNGAMAERFTRLAKIMAEAGVEIVGELSREDAEAAWSGGAT